MLSALDISASALAAQRTRMAAISNNVANISTTRDAQGNPAPYQPRFVVFQTDQSVSGPVGAAGVRVASVETADVEPRWKYEPYHPDAMTSGPHKGYVAYPAVDMMKEFVDSLEAARAYEANIGVMEITKDLAQNTLRILA